MRNEVTLLAVWQGMTIDTSRRWQSVIVLRPMTPGENWPVAFLSSSEWLLFIHHHIDYRFHSSMDTLFNQIDDQHSVRKWEVRNLSLTQEIHVKWSEKYTFSDFPFFIFILVLCFRFNICISNSFLLHIFLWTEPYRESNRSPQRLLFYRECSSIIFFFFYFVIIRSNFVSENNSLQMWTRRENGKIKAARLNK